MTKKIELINKLNNYNEIIQNLDDIELLRNRLSELRYFLITNSFIKKTYYETVNKVFEYLSTLRKEHGSITCSLHSPISTSQMLITVNKTKEFLDSFNDICISAYVFFVFEFMANHFEWEEKTKEIRFTNQIIEDYFPERDDIYSLLYNDEGIDFIKELVSSVINDLINELSYQQEKMTDKSNSPKLCPSEEKIIRKAKEYFERYKKLPPNYSALNISKPKDLGQAVKNLCKKLGWGEECKGQNRPSLFFQKLKDNNFLEY